MQSIESQRATWSSLALRRTTLAPGQSVGGYVYVPIALDARAMDLYVRTGARWFKFPFRQIVLGG